MTSGRTGSLGPPSISAREPSKLSSAYSFLSEAYPLIESDDSTVIFRQPSDVFLDESQLSDERAYHAQRITDVLSIPAAEAMRLLCAFRWRVDDLLDAYMDDPAEARRRAGLAVSPRRSGDGGPRPDDAQCAVCGDGFEQEEWLAAQCGHRFCTTCWSTRARARLAEGRADVQCMAPGCAASLERAQLGALLEPSELARLERLSSARFVDEHPYLRWCPAPGCGRAVKVGSLGRGDVRCACGERFCFGCARGAHAPLSCAQLDAWLETVRESSGSASWLDAHTRRCPGCASPIEKSGGCHHMACARCGLHFCWLCLRDWQTHTECTPHLERLAPPRLPPDASAAERTANLLLRYQHHAHACARVKEMREGAQEGKEEEEIELLVECERALQHSQGLAFFMQRNHGLYEHAQTQLESATAHLFHALLHSRRQEAPTCGALVREGATVDSAGAVATYAAEARVRLRQLFEMVLHDHDIVACC